MAADLQRVRALLDDVDWQPDERRVLDEAITELLSARERAKPSVKTLFGPDVAVAEGLDVALRFVVPTPPSSKNAQKLRVIPGGTRGLGIPVRYRPREVVKATEEIQAIAVDALRRQAPQCFAEKRPLLEDEDARVEMVHNVANETLDVLVRRAGACPRGRTGRRRDVHNLPELVCDAIQRIAFRNDNQVCDLRVWRNVGTPTTVEG